MSCLDHSNRLAVRKPATVTRALLARIYCPYHAWQSIELPRDVRIFTVEAALAVDHPAIRPDGDVALAAYR